MGRRDPSEYLCSMGGAEVVAASAAAHSRKGWKFVGDTITVKEDQGRWFKTIARKLSDSRFNSRHKRRYQHLNIVLSDHARVDMFDPNFPKNKVLSRNERSYFVAAWVCW